MSKHDPRSRNDARRKSQDPNPDVRHNRARRRLLQSLAAGGAAVSVKALPGQWAKPVLDTTTLPAHAQATCALECAVSTVSTVSTHTIDEGNDFAILGFPLTGGETGTVTGYDNDEAPVTFSVTGISAVAGSGCTVDLDVDLEALSVFSVSGGDLQSISNGTSNFNAVEVQYDPPSTDDNDALLNLTFASAGNECVINISFVENPIPD